MPAFDSHVPQAKEAGSWKNWSKFWAKDGGTWKRPVAVHVKSGGSWVKVYDERPIINSASGFYVDTGSGGVLAYKQASISANGFTTSVTTNGDSVDVSSIAVDNTTTVTAVKVYDVGYFGPYPTITATNSSGYATA